MGLNGPEVSALVMGEAGRRPGRAVMATLGATDEMNPGCPNAGLESVGFKLGADGRSILTGDGGLMEVKGLRSLAGEAGRREN
jgi:hypothetical protein